MTGFLATVEPCGAQLPYCRLSVHSPSYGMKCGGCRGDGTRLVITVPLRPAIAVDEHEAQMERLREQVRTLHRAGFYAVMMTPIDHAEDCECEQADACTVESVGASCTEGEPAPTLALDDGTYTAATIDLTELARRLREAGDAADGDDESSLVVGLDHRGDFVNVVAVDDVLAIIAEPLRPAIAVDEHEAQMAKLMSELERVKISYAKQLERCEHHHSTDDLLTIIATLDRGGPNGEYPIDLCRGWEMALDVIRAALTEAAK